MYIVQIKQPTDRWIVSICQIKEDATDYVAKLPAETQAVAFIHEIPVEYFPFIIIQNTELSHDSDSYFEYCNFETVQTRIETARKHKVDSEEHIYLNYYYIAEPYGQMVTEENYMKYMRHTSVTNRVLNEPYIVSLFHEEIKKNVTNYDIDRLDQLFEHTKTRFTSKEEKEDLALNGYDSLFWDMNYDHACGKLTESGIYSLIPMIENMEILLNEKKWMHRSFAQHILLEKACNENPETASSILQDTINAFDHYVISNPEERLEIHRLVSIAYKWMMEADTANAFSYWKLALSEINKAIDFSPQKASWSSLLELLYMSTEDEHIAATQKDELKNIQQKTEALEKQFGSTISYQLALAYKQLQEYLEWKKIEDRFPKMLALRWAEKALAYNPDQTTRINAHEAAEFFNTIGLQTKRIDFLLKTISIYERVMKATDDFTPEIYSIGNLLKEIAQIHINNNEHALADKSIEQAQELYKKHIDLVKRNRSTYQHFAELQEYCYNYEGNITKPTVAELKEIAEKVENESEGFYGYPYELLMRIALFEQNEKQAILECTKSLILHELCVDSMFEKLFNEFEPSSFHNLNVFLDETRAFMEEVNSNYYYDPQVKWKTLSTMSDEEILSYWESRKEEIRNRPPHVRE